MIHGNWLAVCALIDALSDPLEYYDASEILQKLLHYENWTAQYWQFRPHYVGYGDEGDDYVREDSSTERERWLSKPLDVGFVAHTTNRVVDKLLEVFSARRARVTPHPMPIDLAPERFPLRELETLLVIPEITGNSDPHSLGRFSTLEWAIIDGEIASIRLLFQVSGQPDDDLSPLVAYCLKDYYFQYYNVVYHGDHHPKLSLVSLESLKALFESGLNGSHPHLGSRGRSPFPAECNMSSCGSLLCRLVTSLGRAVISPALIAYNQELFDFLIKNLTRKAITVESWKHATAGALANTCSLSADICRGLGRLAARLGFAPADVRAGDLCMENRGTISQRQALLSLSDGYFGGAIPTTAGVIPPSAILLAVETGQRSDGKGNSQQHASKLQEKYANF